MDSNSAFIGVEELVALDPRLRTSLDRVQSLRENGLRLAPFKQFRADVEERDRQHQKHLTTGEWSDALSTTASITYEIGEPAQELGAFLWVRATLISDALYAFQLLLERRLFVQSLLQLRSVIELVSAYPLLKQDLAAALESCGSDSRTYVLKCGEAIAVRGKGTKLDWSHPRVAEFRTGDTKHFKATPGKLDLTAKDLMKGIDALSKVVAGARKTYDFLSEFAHPNAPQFATMIDRIDSHTTSRGAKLTGYFFDSSRTFGASLVVPVLADLLAIVCDVVEYAVHSSAELAQTKLHIEAETRRAIRAMIRTFSGSVKATDPCPCFSGRIAVACCGRLLIRP
jgi:hypothetical protein